MRPLTIVLFFVAVGMDGCASSVAPSDSTDGGLSVNEAGSGDLGTERDEGDTSDVRGRDVTSDEAGARCPGSPAPVSESYPREEMRCRYLSTTDYCNSWARLPLGPTTTNMVYFATCASIGSRTLCIAATECRESDAGTECRCGSGPACAPQEACVVTSPDQPAHCACRPIR